MVKNPKRILITIFIIILILSVFNLFATKIIYDRFFPRYDCDTTAYPEQLADMVANRRETRFLSGENLLCGYLYESKAEHRQNALIVFAPGHNACCDSYLWQIRELMDYGWSVFMFDATGCCHSEGKSAVGFPQELVDLQAALDFIEAQNRFGFGSIALLGHSQGGYAVCCTLAYDYDVAAVISVSGINSAMEGIIGAADDYVGKLAYLNYGPLWLYQATLFGTKTASLKANAILSETDVPVLIVHGAEDREYPPEQYSIYAYKDTIGAENISYLLWAEPGSSGHTNLLFDADNTANDRLIAEINSFLTNTIEKEG